MFITVAQIQEAVADQFNVPAWKMSEALGRGKGRDGRNSRSYSRPRQVAMYLADKFTAHSLNRIGQLFGGRDHSTVIYAITTIERRLETDVVLRFAVKTLENRLSEQSIPRIPNRGACIPTAIESIECQMEQSKIMEAA